ncbi:MAG: MiaB/RimO family radical SAM methylthiotransferase [Candidatus Omnitrophica bacterium]|nr:MiaB/RimO family radical SAM methylthiotransferase [Candidatus Omnitrophota bacterium]
MSNKQNKDKIGILSLGCPRNLVDSESILSKLSLKGHPIVDMREADVAIVNTCAFIEDAKKESVSAILDLIELKKEGKLKKLIVYGCLAQRYNEELKKELPEVDAFVGKISLNHDLKRFSLTPRHYAYLKICEGCINNCSYCVIPKIKGKFVSLNMNSVLQKVEAMDKDKVSELNIVGQDITGYGRDIYGKYKLHELLNKIVKKTKNIGWIRLLYLYPSRIQDELLDLIRDCPKICKYIDLPIQHINNRILSLMRRSTTREEILFLIDKIRKKIPEVAIRTSIIVGFPSETDREFRELVDFVEDTRFERLGAFVYSREEGTCAYNFKGHIPPKIKAERLNEIMLRQQKISQENNKKLLGKTIDVLIDEKQKDVYPVRKDVSGDTNFSNGVYLGRSQYDAPEVDGLVYVKSRKLLGEGEFVKLKVTNTLEYDLVGEVL